MMSILLGVMATHLIERELETYLLSSMAMTKHSTAVQFYGRILQMRTREKGLNIDVTRGQYMMLYNIMCEHNQMVNPEANPNFDLQTFDNLFQAITMAKETYLK